MVARRCPGAERTAAGPGARPRGYSGRRWLRPPGPGQRLRPWTVGAVCGRCWRRRWGCVSAAGSGGARGRGRSGCARPSRGSGPARWRRGGGQARPARTGPEFSRREHGRGGRRGAAPLSPPSLGPRVLGRRGAYLLGPRVVEERPCSVLPPSPPSGDPGARDRLGTGSRAWVLRSAPLGSGRLFIGGAFVVGSFSCFQRQFALLCEFPFHCSQPIFQPLMVEPYSLRSPVPSGACQELGGNAQRGFRVRMQRPEHATEVTWLKRLWSNP